MREKKWKNCPCCGAKDSMAFKDNVRKKYSMKSYPPLWISSISGYRCKLCHEMILSRQSSRDIDSHMMAHKAAHDAKKVTAARLMLAKTAAAILHVTLQAIHKMMREGRLAYVFIDNMRFPLRSAVMQYRRSR